MEWSGIRGMDRRGLVCALIWVFCGAAACGRAPQEGRYVQSRRNVEIHVPDDYGSIQDAVDAAASGDVVRVASGAYTENVTLHSGVTLAGAGRQSTVLHGQVIFDNATDCEIRGLTVTRNGAAGLGLDIGIGGQGGSAIIEDNTIEGFAAGVGLNGVSAGRVAKNIIRLNDVGLDLSEVSGVAIENNQVLNNTDGGVVLYSYCAVDVYHNTFVGNGFGAEFSTAGAAVVSGPFNNENVQNNIMISNKGGINAYEASSDVHHNLVWGNLTNYVGEAGPGAGDVMLDPSFVDPGAKDFRLQGDSPAVDSGVAVGVAGDFSGQLRPAGAGVDMGAFEFQIGGGADLVINEVMANPLDEARGEYIELYNPTDRPLDAAGLIIDDGDTSDPLISYSGGSTVIQPGGYGVILDQGYSGISEPYTIPVEAILLTVPNAALGSGISTSDPLILWRDGVQISGYAHPFDPGNGIAAERIDPQAADDADNWAPAPCSASPGQANCVSSGGGGGVVSFVVISEVMASPVVSTSGEFIELYNYGDDPVELAGLVISDGDSTDTLVSVSGKSTSLGPGQYGVIIDPDLIPNMTGAPYHLDSAVPVVVTVADTALGNGLAKSDPLTLFAADGQTVLSTYAHPLSTDAQSVERIDALEADLPSNWMPSPCVDGHSAGRANCAAGGGGPVEVPPIVINEVMANALDEDRGEFIELYNYGDTAVDVAGFVISDGDATDRIEAFPGFSDTVIPAGGYGVILDPEYADQYSLPTGAVRLAPDDTTLGNSLATNDPITLYLEDGVTVVSTFSFPFNPGNGISVEKRDDSGDAESNWVASPCSSGASPGGLNCASEGGDPPDPNAELVIAEVMANPLVESSGEFIEITNVGAQAIDLAGYLISDGDAVDALQSFAGETTTLAAGGIAVVLDASYPDPGPYDIPLSAVLLTTEDAAIGSGLAIDDTVSLLDPDGVTVISTYNHPFNPGNGVSVERVDLAAPDDPTNWVASPCASGSSPGELNCAGGGGQPGVTVVDVNTASSAELQQVTGIGPSTANAIVNYRTAYGSFESLDQLQVIDSVTGAKVDDWMVAAADEDPFVIGLAGGQEVQVFADLDALFAALPNPATPGAWDGVPVRVQRTVLLSQNDYAEQQNLTFGSWGDESAFEPTAPSTIAVYLDRDPAETSYHRDQTDSVDALADWIKEDGAPYRMPLFYRWSGAHYGWGELEYAHVFAIEGVVEVYGGEWQIRVRAKVDAGLDRVVRIEKWLAPDSWTGIVTVWTYAYKPVVVEATSGYHHCLPYRLALAHPCRQYWFDTYGQWIDVPRCVKFGECYGCMPDWVLFNQAVAEWRNVANQGDGYCFDHDSVEYCFTTAEETTGLDILNNATFTQLTAHCYTNSLANVILANRPFTSIAAYDQTSGVGSTSLWDLLVCYVRSGDWPPAAFGTVARVLQEIPANEYQTVTVDSATVDSRNGSLFEICDPASADCIQVYSSLGLPASLSVGDTVRVTGEVRWYSAGQFWEILVSESGHLVEILQEG